MELSSSLLKEFAETTNDSEEVTSRSTAYGTVVTGSDYRTYVQLDGSDQLTAISEGTAVQAGDRVIVTIENHVATVTTNLSVPATGRLTSTMVNEAIVEGYFDVLTAEFATFEYVDTYYISAEEADLKYATIEILASDYITTKDIEATFATIENLNASIANVNELFASYAQIIDADIQDLYAATANIDDLTAKVAAIEEAYISYAEVQELLAGYASIEDLNAAYASITLLDASVANITNLLAGNAGVGDLQSIHLTADNAVIEYAVIEEALMGTILADIIKSNIIYTDQITIMSEDGGIYIVGNQMQFSNGQIQFYDDNGVCRLQIGQDTSGNFTFVLYDETGTGIMIDSEGIHESAVPDGLIVDSMVAEDANIAASKIDMADVISYINDSGDLILDAYQIYIDGERLDYKLTEITESAVSEVINYYAIGPSPYEPPFEPGEETVYTDAICGIAICGLTYVGTIGWTTTRLYASGEGEYVWFVQKKIYVDGSYSWTEPTCLTDDYVRTKVSTMTTELEVVQGEISAKIWLTDIEDATNVLGDEITTITDQYAELDVTINEISAALGELTTSIGPEFEYFYSAIADITVQIDNISMGVSQNLEYIYGIYDEIEDLESQGIKSRTAYFAISYSPDYYPPYSLSPSIYTAITGLAICGLAIVGNTGYWTTEQPIPEEGQYVWLSYYVEKLDGSTYWETPILLSDEAAREQFTYISSQIAGIQIALDEIDIGIQNVYSYVDDEIEYVNERTAEIVLTLDEIDLGLRSLESIETEHYNYLYDQYTGISLELGSITARVEETGEAVKSRVAYYALSYSSEYYPDLPGFTTIVDYNPSTGETTTIHEVDLSPSIYTAITGLAICGLAIVGNTGYWSDERPDASDGGYIWIAYLVTTIDGDQYWEDPVLLSDDVARSQYAILSQRYAEIELEINSISLTVYDSGLGTAYIGLSVGDETSEVEVVTKAREAFANSSSSITIAAGTITFIDGTLVIEGVNFSLDADGNAVFGGTLTSPGGMIGGFYIGADSIYTISDDFNLVSDNIYIGSQGISLGTAFSVTKAGVITASSGTIGGWNFTGSRIRSSSSIKVGGDEPGFMLVNEDDRNYVYAFNSSGSTVFTIDRNGATTVTDINVNNNFKLLLSGSNATTIIKALSTTTSNAVGGTVTMTNFVIGDAANSSGIKFTLYSGAAQVEFTSSMTTFDNWVDMKSSLDVSEDIYCSDLDCYRAYSTYTYTEYFYSERSIHVATDTEAGYVYFENTEKGRNYHMGCSSNDNVGLLYTTTSNGTSTNHWIFCYHGRYSSSDIGIVMPPAGDDTTSSSANTYMSSGGRIQRSTSSSSIRYKTLNSEMPENSIEKFYSIPVYWYTYNKDYLKSSDQRYMKQLPGFVAEDWEEACPVTVDYNEDGSVERWNPNFVTPIMFEMIKYDHDLILESEDRDDNLQLQIDDLKAENKALKEELAAIKAA